MQNRSIANLADKRYRFLVQSSTVNRSPFQRTVRVGHRVVMKELTGIFLHFFTLIIIDRQQHNRFLSIVWFLHFAVLTKPSNPTM